jgi:hypothetical protein
MTIGGSPLKLWVFGLEPSRAGASGVAMGFSFGVVVTRG